MRATPHLLVALFLSLSASACIDPGGKDTSTPDTGSGDPDSADSSDSDTQGHLGDDTEEFEDPIHADISGAVTVQPYTTDEFGDTVLLDWSVYKEYADCFPYGSIFIASYTSDEFGRETYRGETTVASPITAPNPYHLNVSGTEIQDLRVYAALDFWGEGVIENSDPIGVYPRSIDIKDGASIEDIDITIMAPFYQNVGGGGCEGVSVNGTYQITVSYGGGAVATMLLSPGTGVPLHHGLARSIPEPEAGGASGSYSLGACENDGQAELVGAWDSNGNDIFDPADRWGTYVSAPKVDGNPITIGTEDLNGYEVQIPFGDRPGMDVVPFVRLSGTLGMAEGSFADLPEGASVYVTALKYRPSSDLTLDDIEEAYDTDIFAWEDYVGEGSLPFSLIVPANTIVYLWALVDDEPYGLLNEPGDWVGTVSTSDGRVGISDEDIEDMVIMLTQPDAE